VLGDNVAASAFWRDLDEAARTHSLAITDAGGTATILDLPAIGIEGNSHNPMMDDNSDEVAALVLGWLDEVRDQNW
jgi:hypothetical protein